MEFHGLRGRRGAFFLDFIVHIHYNIAMELQSPQDSGASAILYAGR